MKEYGTNVQKLVNYIMTVQDREARTRYAYILVDLMRQVHPNMRDNQDYSNKLWDDLYIMSNFQLDVDSPFPPPAPDAVGKQPKRVPYNINDLKFKHYGRNIELLVSRAISAQSEDERRTLVAYIGKLMKVFYTTWNKEVVEDTVIWQNMREMAYRMSGTGILDNTIASIADASSLGYAKGNNNSNDRNDRGDRDRGRNQYANNRNDRNDRNNGDRNNGGRNDRNDRGDNRNRNNNNNNNNRNNNQRRK
jgi:hypothetical protein